MSNLRTQPTPAEWAVIDAAPSDGPSQTFGFFLKTAAKPDLSGHAAAVLDKPFKLIDGWGTNVIANGQQLFDTFELLAMKGNPVTQHLLLRESGSNQVPVYNPAKLSGTGLPAKTHSISVPR